MNRLPPEDIPQSHRDFWHRYAGYAIDAQTLTPQTEASFRLLCEMESEMREVQKTIAKDGRTFLKVTVDGAGVEHQELKAHPLTGAYRQLAQRVEALMARFGLAPFGKPVATAKKKPAANPWAQVAK